MARPVEQTVVYIDHDDLHLVTPAGLGPTL
jgi:hypothetical protein